MQTTFNPAYRSSTTVFFTLYQKPSQGSLGNCHFDTLPPCCVNCKCTHLWVLFLKWGVVCVRTWQNEDSVADRERLKQAFILKPLVLSSDRVITQRTINFWTHLHRRGANKENKCSMHKTNKQKIAPEGGKDKRQKLHWSEITQQSMKMYTKDNRSQGEDKRI